jgi:hypothetical protein
VVVVVVVLLLLLLLLFLRPLLLPLLTKTAACLCLPLILSWCTLQAHCR